jgi:hypothetical protein
VLSSAGRWGDTIDAEFLEKVNSCGSISVVKRGVNGITPKTWIE